MTHTPGRTVATRTRGEVAQATDRPGDEKIVAIKTSLERYKKSFEAVLPKHVSPDRMVRTALLAIQRDKTGRLRDCSGDSIAQAVMKVSIWGLEIGETAHIVPFGNEAVPIAGYQGKIELATRAKMILKCDARVVRKGEEFRVEYGLKEKLVHLPDIASEEPLVAVYAIVILPNGLQKFEIMSRAQVDKIKARAKGSDKADSGWVTSYEEMAKKTVVNRLLKMIPKPTTLPLDLREFVTEGLTNDEEDLPVLEAPIEIRGSGMSRRPVNSDPLAEAGAQAAPTVEVRDVRQDPASVAARAKKIEAANAVVLPGKEESWGGYGGQALEKCPTSVLQGFADWVQALRDKGEKIQDSLADADAAAQFIVDLRATGELADPGEDPNQASLLEEIRKEGGANV